MSDRLEKSEDGEAWQSAEVPAVDMLHIPSKTQTIPFEPYTWRYF